MVGFPSGAKWAVAMLLMGFPFLLFGVISAMPVILLVLTLFRARRDAVGSDLAVDRGGARSGRPARRVHGRVRRHGRAPFLGLQVCGEPGDTAMWAASALAATVAASLGAFAVRGAVGRRVDKAASAVLET